jgi:hypothetical protein
MDNSVTSLTKVTQYWDTVHFLHKGTGVLLVCTSNYQFRSSNGNFYFLTIQLSVLKWAYNFLVVLRAYCVAFDWAGLASEPVFHILHNPVIRYHLIHMPFKALALLPA